MKDPASDLQTLAETTGYLFVFGEKDMVNFEVTKVDLSTTKKVFILFPPVETVYAIANDGPVSSINVDLKIWFGKKFDVTVLSAGTDQLSSLDETYAQKYTRRLKTLKSDLYTFLDTFICSTSYHRISQKIVTGINLTDENIDVVICDLTLRFDAVD